MAETDSYADPGDIIGTVNTASPMALPAVSQGQSLA
jgi:hypothetical protein